MSYNSNELMDLYNDEICNNPDINSEMKEAIIKIIDTYRKNESHKVYLIIKELNSSDSNYIDTFPINTKKRLIQRFLLTDVDVNLTNLSDFVTSMSEYFKLINESYNQIVIDNMYKIKVLPKIVIALKSPNNDVINSLLDTHSFFNLIIDSYKTFIEKTNTYINNIVVNICSFYDDYYGAKLSIQEILDNITNEEENKNDKHE